MAGLGNPAPYRLPPTPQLLGDQAPPRGQLPPLRKGFGLTDGGDQSRSGDGASAFALHQPRGPLPLPSQLGELPVMTRASCISCL
jgi:hypothetical protein